MQSRRNCRRHRILHPPEEAWKRAHDSRHTAISVCQRWEAMSILRRHPGRIDYRTHYPLRRGRSRKIAQLGGVLPEMQCKQEAQHLGASRPPKDHPKQPRLDENNLFATNCRNFLKTDTHKEAGRQIIADPLSFALCRASVAPGIDDRLPEDISRRDQCGRP